MTDETSEISNGLWGVGKADCQSRAADNASSTNSPRQPWEAMRQAGAAALGPIGPAVERAAVEWVKGVALVTPRPLGMC